MTVYDLHCHSTASDGVLSPRALVERAASMGVQVLALTDHDELRGLDEAREVAEALGIRLVMGVEISVSDRKSTRLNSSHRYISRMPSSA
jgi:predicted metal-dependent phosphoesterase TrpH